jgi:cytidyltransferase-like protein
VRAEGRGKLAVVSQEALILQRAEWKRNGKRVVCASGAFDLLHPGHVRLLEQARGLGDALVVGIAADEATTVNPANERAEVVAALVAVDSVAVMDGASEDFVAAIAPEIFVHGTEPRRAAAVSVPQGSRVVAIPLEPGFSTAGLLERIKTTNA